MYKIYITINIYKVRTNYIPVYFLQQMGPKHMCIFYCVLILFFIFLRYVIINEPNHFNKEV